MSPQPGTAGTGDDPLAQLVTQELTVNGQTVTRLVGLAFDSADQTDGVLRFDGTGSTNGITDGSAKVLVNGTVHDIAGAEWVDLSGTKHTVESWEKVINSQFDVSITGTTSPVDPSASSQATEVAYGGASGTTHVHSIDQQTQLTTFSQATTEEVAVGDEYVVYGGGDVFVHNIATNSLEYTLTDSAFTTYGIDVSPSYIAFGGTDDSVYVYDKTGTFQQELTQGSNIRSVAVTDAYVAYGDENNEVHLHDTSDWSVADTFTQATSNVYGVDIAGGAIVYGAETGNAYVHDIATGSLTYTLTQSGGVESVAITATDVAYGDGDVYVHSLSDGSLRYTLTDQSFTTYSIAMNGSYVVTGGSDDSCYVYDVADGSLTTELQNSTGDIFGVGLQTQSTSAQLDVTADVTNSGTDQDTQTLTLDINNGVGQVDSTSVTLAGGGSTTQTLSWAVPSGQTEQDYTATVASADDSASQTVTVSSVPPSLVSHWTFDDPDTNSGTAVDVVGSNDGTINGATTGVSGANETYATNEAYSFDGSGDGVDFGRVGDGLEAFSVAAWVNPDSLAGDASILIRDGGTKQTDRHWALRIDDSSGTVGLLVQDSDNTKIVTRSSATISTGSWSHLVGTVGGTTATIYVDGTAEGSSSNSSYGVHPTSAQPAKAAGADPGGYVYYDGEIDDARFYDKELNSTEVSNLYNNGGI